MAYVAAHEFALYVSLPLEVRQGVQELSDEALVHRLKQVLRVIPGERVLFFNETERVVVEVVSFSARSVRFSVLEAKALSPLIPPITALIPMLEKDAFERALSFASMLGVTTVMPVVTRKTRRAQLDARERDRLRRVMIAAAEQSKQFVLPVIGEVRTLDRLLIPTKLPTSLPRELRRTGDAGGHPLHIFFDPAGEPLQQVTAQLQGAYSYTVMVGPEGDLTADEKELLRQHGFVFCRLTPTVLRSEYAFLLGCGMLRSLV